MNKFGPVAAFHYNGQMYRMPHASFHACTAQRPKKVCAFHNQSVALLRLVESRTVPLTGHPRHLNEWFRSTGREM